MIPTVKELYDRKKELQDKIHQLQIDLFSTEKTLAKSVHMFGTEEERDRRYREYCIEEARKRMELMDKLVIYATEDECFINERNRTAVIKAALALRAEIVEDREGNGLIFFHLKKMTY